jgi:hypothetical protein
MTYNLLLPQLWPVADGVAAFLKREWGIHGLRTGLGGPYKQIKLVPTFHATMPDHHVLWVEVSNRAYPPHLDGIVADCMQHGFPVRLVVAIPVGLKGSEFAEDLARARMKAVGVIAVEGTDGEILANPLSQSLTGVHPISRSEFPAKLRFQLSQAESTFRQGDPAKACDSLYGITEDISRKAAKATHARGLWYPSARPPRFDKDPWDSVINSWVKNLDTSKCNYFGDNILYRIIGETPYRNKVVHVPKNNNELRARDRMLRTRFEDAANILLELVNDVKPLKIKLP